MSCRSTELGGMKAVSDALKRMVAKKREENGIRSNNAKRPFTAPEVRGMAWELSLKNILRLD